MPLRDWLCTSCDTVSERYYEVVDKEIITPICTCNDKTSSMKMMPLNAGQILGKTAIFPYSTTHLTGDGKPITVSSLSQLRRIERQYGVCSTAFSQEPNNPDSPAELPVGRPGGREFEPQNTDIFRNR